VKPAQVRKVAVGSLKTVVFLTTAEAEGFQALFVDLTPSLTEVAF
jgi:hypothetical protein